MRKLTILVMMVLFGISTSQAYDFTVGGIYYNKSGTNAIVTYKTTSYNSYSGSITIPSTVTYSGTTYNVKTIGDYAFRDCSGLTSITLPNTITSIGQYAFYNCTGLTSITIPSSVTSIDQGAFFCCSGLTQVNITDLNAWCKISFGGPTYFCNPLYYAHHLYLNNVEVTEVVFPNTITSISNHVFTGCYSLTRVTIPSSVRTIGDYAFQLCTALTSVTIPNSVTTIGKYAFSSCYALTNLSIGNSVTSINYGAFFYDRGLTSISVSSGNTVYDSREGCNAIIETASNKLLYGCMNTIIPNTVKTIGVRAFNGCTGLTSITIPESVITINDSAFYNCNNMVNATIGNSVKTIGANVFRSCTKLASVTIGSSVTTIGDNTFNGCSALASVTCLATTPPTIQEYTFNPYPDMLYVPMESVDAYNTALYWRSFGNITGIVPGLNTFVVDGIYYSSLNGNTAKVVANENVEGYYTGDVVIPSTVTYQGTTFDVVAIDDNAFDGCYDLTSVVIGENVTSIGEQAFQGCSGLTSVTIGSNVASIASKAFSYCNALATVTCLGTVPPVMASSDCFSNVAYNRAKLLVPREAIETYQATDYWYRFATIEGTGNTSAGLGDVNGDGRISISDVTTLIDMLLNNSDYFENGDMNGNGRLDIGDVTTLIDSLLNGN